MRLLVLLLGIGLGSLACSGLGGKEEASKGEAAPKMAELPAQQAPSGPVTSVQLNEPGAPAVLPSTKGVEQGQQAAVQSGHLLPPNITKLDPEIPPGDVLEDYDRDVDYLAKTQKIESCPKPATVQEKVSGYEIWRYCGLSNGVRHGPWMAFYRGGKGDGKLKEIGPYYGGYRNGWFTHWNEFGQKDSHYEWLNGEPVNGEIYK